MTRCARSAVVRLAALAVLAAAVCACSPPPPRQGTVVINRGNGPEVKSLDPAYIDGNWEEWVVGDMLLGLTTEGPDGRPVPGAATHWQVSPDGLTWTFYLRDHVWSDGVPVTAADFVTAWRREMDPKTGAVYSYVLWPIKNAKAISEGKLPPSTLGVRALDDRTLQVTLEHPVPYMIELMTHPAAYPIPRHVYKKFGSDWSKLKNYVANGPYIIKDWVPLDRITLIKNKRFYDAKDVQIDVENYFVTNDTEAALKRYRAGELDTVSNYPLLEIDWIRSHIPDEIKTVPYLATDYLVPNFKNPLMRDLRLRRVLSLAYDRTKLVDQIRRLGEPPAYALVPPGIANYPHTAHLPSATMPYDERLAKAQALMRQMGYGPDHHLRLSFLTATNPDTVRTAAVMQGMYAQVYIDVVIDAEERQTQIADLQQGNFVFGDSGWGADFNDASNFLDLLRCGSQENLGGYCDPAFDALMTQADNERDAVKRGKIMAQAEQLALNDVAVVPLYFNVTQDLAKPYVKGWIANPKDFNRTRWLRIEGRPPQ